MVDQNKRLIDAAANENIFIKIIDSRVGEHVELSVKCDKCGCWDDGYLSLAYMSEKLCGICYEDAILEAFKIDTDELMNEVIIPWYRVWNEVDSVKYPNIIATIMKERDVDEYTAYAKIMQIDRFNYEYIGWGTSCRYIWPGATCGIKFGNGSEKDYIRMKMTYGGIE